MSLHVLKENLPKIILGTVGSLLVVLMIYGVLSLGGLLFPPQLLLASPKDGEKGVSPFATIALKFNENLSQDNKTSFSILPKVDGTVVINGTLLEFIPSKHLDYAGTYSISLKDPKNSLGRAGTTVFVTFSVKSRDQLTPDDLRQLQGETDKNFIKGVQQGQDQTLLDRSNARDRILAQLPYQTDNFKVEYLIDSDTFKITVLKNPYQTNKQAALDWFTNNGVKDLTWFKYEFASVKGVF